MFEFSTEFDGNSYKTLTNLVKSNNGQFKSYKQAQFLTKTYRALRQFDNVESVRANFGIEMTESQYVVMVNAYTRWVNYGSDSYRPVTWVFVMDEHGVVAQYKLGYVGTMRQGTSPDPSKTQQLWARTGAVTPLEQPEQPVVAPSEHIGQVGSRMTFEGMIKSVTTFFRRRVSYYDSGVGYLTRVSVDGNEVVYFGQLGEKGATVKFVATVKEHGEYNGRKQTVVSRPKVIETV